MGQRSEWHLTTTEQLLTPVRTAFQTNPRLVVQSSLASESLCCPQNVVGLHEQWYQTFLVQATRFPPKLVCRYLHKHQRALCATVALSAPRSEIQPRRARRIHGNRPGLDTRRYFSARRPGQWCSPVRAQCHLLHKRWSRDPGLHFLPATPALPPRISSHLSACHPEFPGIPCFWERQWVSRLPLLLWSLIPSPRQ